MVDEGVVLNQGHFAIEAFLYLGCIRTSKPSSSGSCLPAPTLTDTEPGAPTSAQFPPFRPQSCLLCLSQSL